MAYIFRVEEEAKQETNMKQGASRADPEDGGDTSLLSVKLSPNNCPLQRRRPDSLSFSEVFTAAMFMLLKRC
jgi:hypothetical protein